MWIEWLWSISSYPLYFSKCLCGPLEMSPCTVWEPLVSGKKANCTLCAYKRCWFQSHWKEKKRLQLHLLTPNSMSTARKTKPNMRTKWDWEGSVAITNYPIIFSKPKRILMMNHCRCWKCTEWYINAVFVRYSNEMALHFLRCKVIYVKVIFVGRHIVSSSKKES